MWSTKTRLLLLNLFVISSRAQYETLDDNLIFNHESVESLRHHMYCYIDRGPCDDVELSYKQHLAHALLELCEKCNDGQKMGAFTFHTHAALLFPEELREFRQIYDTEGKYDAFLAAVTPHKHVT